MSNKKKTRQVIKINEGTNNERVIGLLDVKKRMFMKSVKFSKHLFRKFDAWGIDADYFTEVLLPRDCKIQVWDKEEDIVYEIDAKEFAKKAKHFHFKNQTGDHRAQIFCPRRHWLRLSKVDQETRDTYLKYCV